MVVGAVSCGTMCSRRVVDGGSLDWKCSGCRIAARAVTVGQQQRALAGDSLQRRPGCPVSGSRWP